MCSWSVSRAVASFGGFGLAGFGHSRTSGFRVDLGFRVWGVYKVRGVYIGLPTSGDF